MPKNIILTFDLEWAPDWMIMPILKKLKEKKITSHFFLTHNSKLFSKKNRYIKIGLHPNFFKNSTQGSSEKNVIDNLLKIYGKVDILRTHGNYQSTNLHVLLTEKYKFKIDNSILSPRSQVFNYDLIWKKRKIEILSYNWEDGYETNQIQKIFSLKNKFFNNNKIKLYILNFHPVHIFLNTRYSDIYKKMKKKFPNINKTHYSDLEKFINRKTVGTKNFFESVITSKDIKFFKLKDYKKILK